jgi:hypothetical protein
MGKSNRRGCILESPPPTASGKGKGSRSIKGGARKGAGRKTLENLNLVSLQAHMSLPPDVVEWLNACAKWRDDEPKQYPERHRVDVLRDILTAVANLLRASSYSEVEQAKLIKRLDEVLFLKEEGKEDDETSGST